MENNKGIVLDVTEDGLVVLGKDGLFYRLPRPSHIPLIGEEVELPPRVQGSPVPRNVHGFLVLSRMRTWAMAACILLVVSAAIFLFPAHPQAAYVVALDINPSLELYVDEEDRVIKGEALDREGKEWLSRLNLEELPLSAALEQITREAKAEGMLSGEESRVIATVVQWKEDLDRKEIEKKVEKQLAGLEERDRVVVAYADKKTLKQAHDRNLSVTRYAIAKTLEEKHIPYAEEEIASAPVGELLKKYGLIPAEVLKGDDPSEGKGSKGGGKNQDKTETTGKNPGAERPVPVEKQSYRAGEGYPAGKGDWAGKKEEKKGETREVLFGHSGGERREERGDGQKSWAASKPGNGEEKERTLEKGEAKKRKTGEKETKNWVGQEQAKQGRNGERDLRNGREKGRGDEQSGKREGRERDAYGNRDLGRDKGNMHLIQIKDD